MSKDSRPQRIQPHRACESDDELGDSATGLVGILEYKMGYTAYELAILVFL